MNLFNAGHSHKNSPFPFEKYIYMHIYLMALLVKTYYFTGMRWKALFTTTKRIHNELFNHEKYGLRTKNPHQALMS